MHHMVVELTLLNIRRVPPAIIAGTVVVRVTEPQQQGSSSSSNVSVSQLHSDLLREVRLQGGCNWSFSCEVIGSGRLIFKSLALTGQYFISCLAFPLHLSD